MSHINKPVPNAKQFFPLNEPLIGTAYTDTVSGVRAQQCGFVS